MTDRSDATSTGDNVGANAPGIPLRPTTRPERRVVAVEEWRSRVLSTATPAWQWVACFALFLTALAYAIVDPGIASLVVLLLATIATVVGSRAMKRHDAAVRTVSSMTPVMDPSILAGEVSVLAATSDTLLKTVANPNSTVALRRLALLGVMSAAHRIMARGGVTDETAAVAGYAAWPEVERVEMPGNPGDFQTFHLLRIDASAKRLSRSLSEDGVMLAESFASMAGEVIPPARALLAEIGGDGTAADDGADRHAPGVATA